MTASRFRPTLDLYSATLLASAAVGCSHATTAGAPNVADRATFRGVYELGPDRSAFLPCGSAEQWYVSEGSEPVRELRRRMGTQDVQAPGGGLLPPERATYVRRAYAEVQGDTIAVTGGRPALATDRELHVTRVLVVRPATGGACPTSN